MEELEKALGRARAAQSAMAAEVAEMVDQARAATAPIREMAEDAAIMSRLTVKMAMERDMPERQPITLEFGAQKFVIRQLSMGQMMELTKLTEKAGDLKGQAAQMAYAREAIAIALKRDHKDVDVDNLDVDAAEMPKQLMDIVRLGGFEVKDAPLAATGA